MFEGTVPLAHYLTLSAVLFVIGIAGVLVRRNVIVVFMSIEIMFSHYCECRMDFCQRERESEELFASGNTRGVISMAVSHPFAGHLN